MASNIIYSSIDETFPIAGQDNNSQGFRDNFNIIKGALGVAKEEITDLQTNAVLISTLGETNDPVDNDLQGSTLNNASYSDFHAATNIHTTATLSQELTVYDVNFNAEPFHVFNLNTNNSGNLVEFQFKNFSESTMFDDICSTVRVQVHNDGNNAITISNFEVPGGTLVPEASLSGNLTIAASHYKLYEAWTYNKGIHLFVRYIGDFYAPDS